MKTSAQIALLIALVAFGVALYYFTQPRMPAPVACTMEAKICPDGSAVGRTGPLCQFSACPEPAATSTQPDQGIAPYQSGITGTVTLGPTCPVMRNPPDPQCADKPYQTGIYVFRASDATHAYAIGKSAADGSFRFSLPPGDYVLGAGESNLPHCDHPAVTVGANEYATTTIMCDTGIR